MLREDQKQFIKALGSIAHRHSIWDVWSDWLVMASSSFYNSIHRDPVVENEYLARAKRYSADELAAMGRMMGSFIEGMDLDPDRDFLGDVMGELSLHNTSRGQFFTPMSVAQLCADLNVPADPGPGRVCIVNEPACGSGNMVIAFWTAIRRHELPQSRFHFVCQDIDDRAFRMCYLQLAVLGLSAEVCLGDTLRMTTERVWRTPGWYLHQMEDRLRWDAMARLLGSERRAEVPVAHQGEEPAELAPEPEIPTFAPLAQPMRFAEQLALF